MENIKNIIFDLGGVLLDIDFNRTTEAFRNLGFPHFEKMYSRFKVDQLFEKLEKGLVTDTEFYEVLLAVGNEHLTRTDIRAAWNSLLVEFRLESLHFLLELKKRYKVLLLSNTNTIHFHAFNVMLKEQGNVSLEQFFHKTYYSHLMKMRKPDAEIFDYVLKDSELNAEETLFIDDTASNTAAASLLGLKTHLLLAGETIEDLALLAI